MLTDVTGCEITNKCLFQIVEVFHVGPFKEEGTHRFEGSQVATQHEFFD